MKKVVLVLLTLGVGAAIAAVNPLASTVTANSCSSCGTECGCAAGECACGN